MPYARLELPLSFDLDFKCGVDFGEILGMLAEKRAVPLLDFYAIEDLRIAVGSQAS